MISMLLPRFQFLALLMLCLCNTVEVQAHQQKEAYITVLFNERTNNIEVSHRFLIHDAEHVLNILFNDKNDLAHNENTQQRFSTYIKGQFDLADSRHNTLKLTSVGHEVDGKFFWVYQEAPIPISDVLSGILKIRHTALQDIWPRQVNQVNVEKGDMVRSVRLLKNDGWREISFIE